MELFLNQEDQIGSDEVGTGDFFAPIVVVASLIKKDQVDTLKKIGIKDSKKLSDHKINLIYENIKKLNIPYESFILENEKYNELYKKYKNINTIKSILHNYVLFKISQKNSQIKSIYMDQFTINKEKYFEHLRFINKNKIVHNIIFSCKGEEKFISVATSSVIARAILLKYIKEKIKKYKMSIPLGSSYTVVNKFAVEFAKKYGIKELQNNIKQNFKNYKIIKETLKLIK